MNGHWISSTRKLNRHFQSRGGDGFSVLAVNNLQATNPIGVWEISKDLNLDIATNGYGLPNSFLGKRYIDWKVEVEKNSNFNIYLVFARFYVTVQTPSGAYNKQFNYYCTSNVHPTTYTPLQETQYTTNYGVTNYGELFPMTTGMSLDLSFAQGYEQATHIAISATIYVEGDNTITQSSQITVTQKAKAHQ